MLVLQVSVRAATCSLIFCLASPDEGVDPPTVDDPSLRVVGAGVVASHWNETKNNNLSLLDLSQHTKPNESFKP